MSYCSTPGIIMAWCVFACLWDGAYKRSLAADEKELNMLAPQGDIRG